MQKAVFNWSGGKDSALALHKVLQQGKFEVSYLLTTLSETNRRISMHGVHEDLLDAQAAQIGLPLIKVWLPEKSPLPVYEQRIVQALQKLKLEGIEMAIFGDIFLEDLRQYREEQLVKVGFKAEFPLWNTPTSALAEEFIEAGFKTILVSIDEHFLDKSFAGRLYTSQLLADLPANVDPCGENGEFHTYVYGGPLFKQAIPFNKGEVVYKKYESDNDPHLTSGFWYCDLIKT